MRNENMGWECPKCNRCYAPAVQECPNCIPKPNNGTVHSGSPLVYNPTIGAYQSFGYMANHTDGSLTNNNSTINASMVCLNFVEVKGNKYCGNCNRPRANHAVSTYTVNK